MLITPVELIQKIQIVGKNLGFNAVGISNLDLAHAETRLLDWLAKGYHGDMAWMAHHGTKRSRPAELVPGTLSIISVRMDYFPPNSADALMMLNHPERAYISRYALGRDYHKLLRNRLEKFAQAIQTLIGEFGYRVFTDSAPVLEKPIAVKAGLGWMGKHTNILSREAGSWFFLGEIYTDIPLARLGGETGAVEEHCGSCRACLEVCPTQAILAPYELDARRCISYLTIEYAGSIPEDLRPLMGNRIYGCDDCQLICPWNRFAHTSAEADFAARYGLDAASLHQLLQWSETEFLRRFEGSPIRRIGYERWQRNLAVALGNAPRSAKTLHQLQEQWANTPSALVKEHLEWAIKQHSA